MIRRVIKVLSTSAAVLASTVTPVLADVTVQIPKTGAGIPGAFTVSGLISTAVKLLLAVAAVTFFIWLLLGGIKWITSGGDKTKTEEARNQITAALVGLVIVFAAWAIAQLIRQLFGIDIFSFTIPMIPTEAIP